MTTEILAPEPQALATQPRNAVTPAELLRHALDSGADLDRLEKLMDLQERWEANEARKAFADAMAEFKKNPPTIIKDKHVGFKTDKGRTEYDHATIGNVVDKVVGAAAAHGFSHRWDLDQRDGRVIVECVVTHRMGHSQVTKLEASPDTSGGKNGIQSIVSAKSYLERHTLLAAFGLATKDQEDDDGAGADVGTTDTRLADEWIAKAKGAKDRAALTMAFEHGQAALLAVGDMHGVEELRAACNAKRATFPPAAPRTSSRLANIVGAAGVPAE